MTTPESGARGGRSPDDRAAGGHAVEPAGGTGRDGGGHPMSSDRSEQSALPRAAEGPRGWLLTAEQVAEMLSTTPRFVRSLVEKRLIGHVRIGRSARFDPADVAAYVETRKVLPAGKDGSRAPRRRRRSRGIRFDDGP